jgi:hypothetical protein
MNMKGSRHEHRSNHRNFSELLRARHGVWQRVLLRRYGAHVMGFKPTGVQTTRQRLHKARSEHHRAYLADWHNWFTNQCQGPAPTIGERLGKIHIQTCGARNRKGQPCQVKTLSRNGRCKFHGGLSTGPKTPEGKAKALANLRHNRG